MHAECVKSYFGCVASVGADDYSPLCFNQCKNSVFFNISNIKRVFPGRVNICTSIGYKRWLSFSHKTWTGNDEIFGRKCGRGGGFLMSWCVPRMMSVGANDYSPLQRGVPDFSRFWCHKRPQNGSVSNAEADFGFYRSVIQNAVDKSHYP